MKSITFNELKEICKSVGVPKSRKIWMLSKDWQELLNSDQMRTMTAMDRDFFGMDVHSLFEDRDQPNKTDTIYINGLCLTYEEFIAKLQELR